MNLCVEKLSPMMAQWYACKQKAKEAILLFRLGDFYEAFYDDATLLSEGVDVTLTQRQGIPMSGVPAHAAEGYIEKLVEKGYLVAIAEQVEDAKLAKGLVKREIVRVVSPGTLLNSIPENDNNFFASITILNKNYALALLDLSTGELRVSEATDLKELQDEFFRRRPSEVLLSERDYQTLKPLLEGVRITKKENWRFNPQNAFNFLTGHLKVHSLDGFGLQGMTASVTAAGALLSYIEEDLNLSTSHVKKIARDELSSYMAIDKATQRNLELTEPLHKGGKNCTLLKLLNHTRTPMGARLFKSWLTHPLLSLDRIVKRQEAVEELQGYLPLAEKLRPIRDLERLMTRISTGTGTPRDLTTLKTSLDAVPAIRKSVASFKAPLFENMVFPPTEAIAKRIEETLVEEPPVKLGEGKVIRFGVNEELDELCTLKTDSKSWIAQYQSELKEQTGIRTLKIIFSKAFGYCIEVSRGQADKMPDSFQRRQTLVNNERFISPELKAYEEKIFSAEEKIQALESRLYHELRKEIATHSDTITLLARSIAALDCLLSLATVAVKNQYTRPILDESDTLSIEVGRHPVIEASLLGDAFIPNDTQLDEEARLVLITGPNMAGKSTYIRQVALITIMAQIGSFVPAQKAHIGLVDKVFSRIGASDDLSRGQSTFMLEMTETANILNNATSRSLVILDEIGRGTSTFDGISIAWAVAEYLLKMGCKTLFATHYWELTEMEEDHPGVQNVHVAVQEAADRIVFLRKIVAGSTDKSYGIHVARLAGLPPSVLKRAHDVLHKLSTQQLLEGDEQARQKQVFLNDESHSQSAMGEEERKPGKAAAVHRPQKLSCTELHKLETTGDTPKQQEQLSFFTPPPSIDEEELKSELEKLNLNETTPMRALQKLEEWKSKFL